MPDKTRIIVHIEGEEQPQQLYLRGEGAAGLNWEKGVKLTPQEDDWIWETEEPFSAGEFKVLINDQTYELGSSHRLYPGASIRINPKFPD
ncbi:MAG: hypothetical protein H7A36_02385 [Chlamydiales bacterium]|nr:hypothetical protein [Chlamydiales bacterium]